MKTKSDSRSAFLVLRLVFGFALCAVALVLAFAALNKSGAETPVATIVVSQPGTWTATGSMGTARWAHTATLLPNGTVLVAGGDSAPNNIIASAELYNPSTGNWTATGSMTTPREDHTATLLPDGRVLVVGGRAEFCLTTSSAELYDPSTGTWSATGAMQSSRSRHFATLISSGPLAGKVLVAGGYINSNDGACGGAAQLASAELYDPTTGLWSATNDMTKARQSPLGVILPDASVVAIGVLNCCPYRWFNSAESYDPSTQLWVPTNSRSTSANGAAILLPDGRVLVAGGTKGTQPTTVTVADAELFDSSTGAWTATASMFTDRDGHKFTLLTSGQALVSGGFSGGWSIGCNDLSTAELYDSHAGMWFLTGNMTTSRFGHTATNLPNGQVLAVGGLDCALNPRSSAELYTPPPVAAVSTNSVTFGLQLVGTRSVAQSITLTNTGTTLLTISRIAPSADFLQTNTCGPSLPAGESCTINVSFDPTTKGNRAGTLTIADDAASSPQTVALRGIATVAQLSPQNVNFGNQAVGTTSRPQTVTLTNTGSTLLNIQSVAIIGANFGEFSETTTCGSTLPANSSCEINVRFAPTATGTRQASIKVRDDGGGNSQRVKLTGTGTP